MADPHPRYSRTPAGIETSPGGAHRQLPIRRFHARYPASSVPRATRAALRGRPADTGQQIQAWRGAWRGGPTLSAAAVHPTGAGIPIVERTALGISRPECAAHLAVVDRHTLPQGDVIPIQPVLTGVLRENTRVDVVQHRLHQALGDDKGPAQPTSPESDREGDLREIR